MKTFSRAEDEQRFKRRVAHDYFCRFHMTLILAAVIASGLLASKLLLMGQLHSMRLRYPLAILGSYAVFLLLVRVWIWYVSRVHARSFLGGQTRGRSSGGSINIDDIGGGGGGGGGGFRGFGGGSSGGGGASDSWGPAVNADVASTSSSGGGSGGGSHWFTGSSSFDLDLGDDWWILLLLAALVLAIVGASGYLIYAAPDILPEAAWQVALAGTLANATKEADHRTWLKCVLRTSAIPFLIILILGGALGWGAHKLCPQAVKLKQVFGCTVNPH